jgi:hypothetical protein
MIVLEPRELDKLEGEMNLLLNSTQSAIEMFPTSRTPAGSRWRNRHDLFVTAVRLRGRGARSQDRRRPAASGPDASGRGESGPHSRNGRKAVFPATRRVISSVDGRSPLEPAQGAERLQEKTDRALEQAKRTREAEEDTV